ncbi:hypothetical protein KFE80_01745 [bacterium SCSIO 12696]|nr:hypothetical protein KFE80_01745 [bacterium SCSIO 12696]
MDISISPIALEGLKVLGVCIGVFLVFSGRLVKISQDILDDIEKESIFLQPWMRNSETLKKMLQWYLSFYDSVTTNLIKSIPFVVGLISSLVVLWVTYKLLIDK